MPPPLSIGTLAVTALYLGSNASFVRTTPMAKMAGTKVGLLPVCTSWPDGGKLLTFVIALELIVYYLPSKKAAATNEETGMTSLELTWATIQVQFSATTAETTLDLSFSFTCCSWVDCAFSIFFSSATVVSKASTL